MNAPITADELSPLEALLLAPLSPQMRDAAGRKHPHRSKDSLLLEGAKEIERLQRELQELRLQAIADFGQYQEALERASQPPSACNCLETISALIKPGCLPGYGWDETAVRNGLVLAANAIQRAAPTKPGEL